MLDVINDAWRTRTRKPGTNLEKFIIRLFLSNINTFMGTLNLITEDRFPSLIVVKLLFSLSIFIILPVVILSERGLI